MVKKIYNKIIKYTIKIMNEAAISKFKPKLMNLKNHNQLNRCFIIGNGPSLNSKDLNLLKNNKEFCFGSNRIYHIFSETDWRPDIYCVQDYKLILKSFREISDIDAGKKIIAIVPELKYPPIYGDFLRIKLECEDFYPNTPRFSNDITDKIYEGFTVTYMCIQIAIYMGFKEIVLLGVDHSYGTELKPDGTVIKNSITKDHFSNNDIADNLPALFKSTLAYKAAKVYADTHDIRIINATRGGKLDVFERITLEELLEGKNEDSSCGAYET